jgi:cholesterol transport system auxiliary component
MKKKLNALGGMVLIGCCLFLSACATYRSAPQLIFDLSENAPVPVHEVAGLPAIAVAEPNVPAWLDSFEIYYRLGYTNDHQLRPYTNSRWSTPPLQLFAQRLKSGVAAAGGQVLSATETANNVPLVLHIDADDFTQLFDSPEHSSGRVTLRASLFDHRNLVAQKSFSHQVVATSNDAAGGAKALANASDATIADILQWLSLLNLKK